MAGRSTKSRGLGRGLDALFADQAPTTSKNTEKEVQTADGNTIIYIDINDIKPNENQPRKLFDKEKIEELAESIRAHGIIQPLVVRPSGKYYEIVAGERRWRAARIAELSTVPCIIREFTDEENMLVAIIENMQREDLNPIEEAEGLNEMIRVYGLTQEEVSKSVSKSRPYITNALRLLKLPTSVQDLVIEGKMTTGHARALVNVTDAKLRDTICKKVVEDGISVREVEKLVAASGKPKKKPAKRSKSADTLSVERELKDIYGTKVSINQKGKKGTIELEYYSKEELNRLIDILRSVN